MIAGINAALRVQGKEELVLDLEAVKLGRETAILGVLTDDLTRGGYR